MIHVKSALAGLLAVLGAALLRYVLMVVRNWWLFWKSNIAMGFDFGLAFRSPLFWGVVALIFAAGYLWEFSRLSR